MSHKKFGLFVGGSTALTAKQCSLILSFFLQISTKMMSQSTSNKDILRAATRQLDESKTEQESLPVYKDQVSGRAERFRSSQDFVPTAHGILVQASLLGGQEASRTVPARVMQTYDGDCEAGLFNDNNTTGAHNIGGERADNDITTNRRASSVSGESFSVNGRSQPTPVPYLRKQNLIWALVGFAFAVMVVSVAIGVSNSAGSNSDQLPIPPTPVPISPSPSTAPATTTPTMPLLPTDAPSPSPTLPTATIAPSPTPPVPGCGNGISGNGICANDLCCSQWGYCGSTEEYCAPSSSPTASSVPTALF